MWFGDDAWIHEALRTACGDSIAGHVAGAGSLPDRAGWSAWQRDAELADGATSGTITTESLADDDGPGSEFSADRLRLIAGCELSARWPTLSTSSVDSTTEYQSKHSLRKARCTDKAGTQNL